MSEKIKKSWDDTEIRLVRAWHDSGKGFSQLDDENNLPSGTLYNIVNSIPDYRGSRRSIGKWLRCQGNPTPAVSTKPRNTSSKKKNSMTGKDSLHSAISDSDRIERQLLRELDEARKKIARLEAQQAKDQLRRDFLEGQLEEYRKLVKPSQSKKSNTK